jgi:hypothetical protein
MSDDARPNPDDDCFKPPAIPTEVHCLHCNQEYESYLIHWVEKKCDGEIMGFWCCPTPGCDGKGFGFDLLPTDPEYQDENGGWFYDDDDEEDDEFDEEDDLDEDDAWLDDLPAEDDQFDPHHRNDSTDEDEISF